MIIRADGSTQQHRPYPVDADANGNISRDERKLWRDGEETIKDGTFNLGDVNYIEPETIIADDRCTSTRMDEHPLGAWQAPVKEKDWRAASSTTQRNTQILARKRHTGRIVTESRYSDGGLWARNIIICLTHGKAPLLLAKQAVCVVSVLCACWEGAQSVQGSRVQLIDMNGGQRCAVGTSVRLPFLFDLLAEYEYASIADGKNGAIGLVSD